MVNNRTISPPKGEDPTDAERQIQFGPLYSLAEVRELLQGDENIFFVTDKCRDDVMDMAWDTSDVSKLICSLTENEYRNSEWCKATANYWLPCDAYAVVRLEHTRKVFYYIKFAVRTNSKKVVAVVSCHYQN